MLGGGGSCESLEMIVEGATRQREKVKSAILPYLTMPCIISTSSPFIYVHMQTCIG